MSPCKTLTLLAAALALATVSLPAQIAPSTTLPKIEVQVDSELRILAQGFAAAFKQFSGGAVYLWVREPAAIASLGSIRSIQALDGVLLVRTEAGPTHALSAADVLRLSNQKPPAAE